jgi:hypothetical protein
MRDRRKDKETTALTSVRTVHSRAKTALTEINRGNAYVNGEFQYGGPPYPIDEDYVEMEAALTRVIALLEPWAKR